MTENEIAIKAFLNRYNDLKAKKRLYDTSSDYYGAYRANKNLRFIKNQLKNLMSGKTYV